MNAEIRQFPVSGDGPDKRLAITPEGDIKPVSEFTAEEKWWCDGEDCGGWPLTVPHVHTYGDRPTRAVDLLTGREVHSADEGGWA